MARLLPPERDIGVLRAPIRSSVVLVGMFLAVLLAVALLDRIGATPGFAPFAIVGAAFTLFVLAALYSHSRRAIDFYIADRKASGIISGLAGGSALAGLLAIGLAGGAYDTQSAFLLSALGLALGYLLLGFTIAPGLRAFGGYTAGDFIGARFNGFVARLVWACITFTVSFMLLLAALKIAAPLVATVFDVRPATALYATAALAAMATLPGGMRSLSWTQAIQYMVIAIASLVPAAFFASGGPTAQSAIAAQFATILTDSLPAWNEAATVGWALPILMSVVGAASLPFMNARTLTAPSGREAVTSTIWAVLFALMLVLAGFVLFELLAEPIAAQAAQTGGALVQLTAFFTILPPVLAGLLLAGTLAALFALGQAALFSASTALSHDIWDEILDRSGPEGRRIMIARLLIVGVAAAAVMLASWPVDAATLVVWALAMAAGGTFAPLLLGLWWRRCNEIGAIAGMIAGSGFCGLVFLLQAELIPDAVVTSGWTDVSAPSAAGVGLAMSLVITVGLSLVTPAPEKDAQDLAGASDESRLPVRERPA